METFGIETDGCPICQGPAGDAKPKRVLVWEDRPLRLTMSLCSEIPHSKDGPLNTDILSREAPLVPEAELRGLADRVRHLLATGKRTRSERSMPG